MVQQSLRMSHRDVPGHHIGMSQDVQWGCPRTSNRDVLRESVTERHWHCSAGQGGAKKRVNQLISDNIGFLLVIAFQISMDLICPAAPHMFWKFSRGGVGWGGAGRGGAGPRKGAGNGGHKNIIFNFVF